MGRKIRGNLKVAGQNCQNFVYLLYRLIRLEPEHPYVTATERSTWKAIPNRITQVKTLAQKVTPWIVIGGAVNLLEAAGIIAADPSGLTGIFLVRAVVIPMIYAKGKVTR